MEELRSTRHWGKKPHGSAVFTRSAYDDFFGGLPRHTTSFPARFEDYCEIFGSAASVSSIPVLDLPPADEDFLAAGDGDRRVGVDYSEIFEGLSGAGFTVSYEELLSGSNGSGASYLDVRAPWGVLSEQQDNEASEHLREGYSKEHLTNLEDEVASVPNHSDDVSSKQFSILYQETSRGIADDIISEEPSAAKFDAIPEFTAMVDARDPVLEMKNQQVNKRITNNTGTKRYIHDKGLENEAPSNSSSNVGNSENLKGDQAPPSESNFDSLLDSPENEEHHSRSSSYHSASSGDISLSDVGYLNISEISLQTKPLQRPPPSRPPPQLIKKIEHPKKVHTDSSSNLEEGSFLKPKLKFHMHTSSGSSKIHAIGESMENNSFCYDNDLERRSAAAASVAAVKAAMEQAQVQLKIAKELMDRKREKYKRKIDQPKSMTCEEDGSGHEVALKSCSKATDPYNMLRNAGTKTLNHEKNGQFSTCGGNQPPVTRDEISGEWKTDKKYYELMRHDSLLNGGKDNYKHDNEKTTKAAMNGFQDICKDNKKGEQAFEVLENPKSSEASCSIEKEENDHNLKIASMAYMESNKNVVHEVMEDFLLTKGASKLNEAYSYHLLDTTQKEGDVQEDNVTEDNGNSSSSVVGSCSCKDSEKISQASNSSFELGVNNDFCEEIEFSAAEIVRNVGNKREFHVSHVNFELNEGHKVFTVVNEAVFHGGSDERIRLSDGLCSNNITDKIEVDEETKNLNENVKETECMNHLYPPIVSISEVEENNNVAEKDEVNELQGNEEACILAKNVLEQEAFFNGNVLENGKERKGAQIEHLEGESMRPDRNNELHNFELFAATERDCAEKGSENTSEDPVACNLGKNKIISTSAKEACQQCEESDASEINLSRKKDNSLGKAPNTTEVCHAEVDENHKDSIHIDAENKKVDIEKERHKERAIRLEEKEREREREKDRIAVERANHDARQQALAEARERAERVVVEKVTAEARQRALIEAREKAGKATEAEKASREARLRAERAAVERATEEARQRAIEKAIAEKAAIEARSRMRKGSATAYFKADNIKEDSETRIKSSSESQQNTQSLSGACFTNGQRYSDSCDNGGSESKLRCKARQERQQRTAERAAKALAEKNLRDCLAQREQAERDRFAESLDAEVRRWSSGKDGNLRALLSTLQYILGSDSGWQPIPLTDVLTAAAVKKAYRKATLCVHPDKLQQRGATIQQKYICEKVFDLLKEAWNKFNSEER